MTLTRTITTHNPLDRLMTDLADWVVTVEPAPLCEEIILRQLKVILINPDAADDDLDWCLAHTFAHLDLGHLDDQPPGQPFTVRQEKDAGDMADLLLDRESESSPLFDLPPMDGDPTLPLRVNW